MAKIEKTAVAEVDESKQLPISADFASELAADSGQGFEGVKATDVAIPYYSILQALSPQVKRGPQNIDGAREGDIFNTVTNEVIPGEKGVIIIPCAFVKSYVEWVPRDSGGGFVKQHSDAAILNQCTPDKDGRPTLPNGNHIVDTAYHYVLRVFDDGRFERALIAMTSTQMKKSRRWLAQQMNLQVNMGGKVITPPPYSHTYHVTSVGEDKDSYSWFGWNINNPKLVEDIELYRIAKKFAQDIVAGQVEVAPPPSDAGEAPSAPGANHEHF